MVAMGITWNGLTRPYFFDKGLRLSTDLYEPVLEFYKREGDRLFENHDWGFQQDGASAHTSHESQERCKKLFEWYIPKDRWPPNTPELNPMDYSVWNEISTRIDFRKVTTRDELIKEIKKAAKNISKEYCQEIVCQYLRRVCAIEKNNGHHITNNFS